MTRLSQVDFIHNQLRLLQSRPAVMRRFESEYRTIADETKPVWIRHAAIWKLKSSLRPCFQELGLHVEQFRYEELVSKADKVIRTLLEACHLPASTQPKRSEAVYVGFGPGGTDRTRPLDMSSLSMWNGLLDASQQADVLDVAGNAAASFGYG